MAVGPAARDSRPDLTRASDANATGKKGDCAVSRPEIVIAMLLPLHMAWAAVAFAEPPAQGSADEPSLNVVRAEFSDWWNYWMQTDDNSAARLKVVFLKDWERASGADGAYRDGEDPSNYNRRIDLSRAEFLCEWKDAHAAGNPRPLTICGSRLASEIVAAREAPKTAVVQKAAKAKSDATTAAAKREAQFNQTVGQLSEEDLCRSYHGYKYDAAREELIRRNSLTQAEWELVNHKQVKVGMSELALVCAMGPAEINRTVTAAGTRKQYVYFGGTYVYVENGVVVGFQD
jgi:hypothetical protein